MVAAAIVGGAVIGGVATSLASDQQSDAAEGAAQTQAEAADRGVAEQRRQFNAIQTLLKPYVEAGTPALKAQQSLIGLNGDQAQADAYSALERSPAFSALLNQGENAILQNASATGGLRGGNTQGALSQFRPQLLNQLIEQQYGRLGGLTTLGQNSAVMQSNLGQQSAGNIASLLQQAGAAQAGGIIGAGTANANATRGYANSINQGIGTYVAYQNGGGF